MQIAGIDSNLIKFESSYHLMIQTFSSRVINGSPLAWGVGGPWFFGVKPQLEADHTFYSSMSALEVGRETILRCRHPVGIPPKGPSLADEVA